MRDVKIGTAQGYALGQQSITACFCEENFIGTQHTNHLYNSCGCFGTAVSELCSCDRGHIGYKAESIYYVALYRQIFWPCVSSPL